MKRSLFLSLLLATGCAYSHYRFGISIPGAEGNELSLSRGNRFKAEVTEASGRKVKPEQVSWQFGGVLAPEKTDKKDKRGFFAATGPGTGIVRASFLVAGEKKTLEKRFAIKGMLPTPVPTLEPTPAPVESLLPSPTMEPTPKPLPTSTPAVDDAEAVILRAYEQAGKGEHLAALSSLERIKDPSWLPKVRALRAEWGKLVADQIIEKAAKALLDKDLAGTLKQLEQLKGLSLNPKQQEQEKLIRKRLKDLL